MRNEIHELNEEYEHGIAYALNFFKISCAISSGFRRMYIEQVKTHDSLEIESEMATALVAAAYLEWNEIESHSDVELNAN